MRLLAFIFIGTMAYATSAQELVVKDETGRRTRSKTIIAQVTEEQAVREGLGILQTQGITVGHFDVYESKADYDRYNPQRPLSNGCSYDRWVRLLRLAGFLERGGCAKILELIRIGDAISFRSVDEQCREKRVLLLGKHDPRFLALRSGEVEVVAIGTGADEYQTSSGLVRYDEVGVFAMARQRVSMALARDTFSYLRDLTGAGTIDVTLRSDPWFIGDCFITYPFAQKPLHIPSRETYAGSKQVYCSMVYPYGGPNCHEIVDLK